MNTDEHYPILGPSLQQLEKERIQLIARNKKVGIYGLLAVIVCTLLIHFLLLEPAIVKNHDLNIFHICFIISIVIFLSMGYFNNQQIAAFQNKAKSTIVNKVIKFVDATLTYTAAGNIDIREFNSSGIFYENAHHFNCEDGIEGKVNGTSFRVAEIKAEKKTGKSDYTFFHGPFVIVELDHHYTGETYILPTLYRETWLNWVSRKLWNGGRAGEEVEFPNSTFGRDFRVISNTPDQAQHLLTEHFKSQLQSFGRRTYASFIDNQLYLALDQRKDLFFINPDKTILKAAIVKRLREDMEQLVALVKDLNLAS